MKFIVSDGRPLSTVDSPNFIQMLKTFDGRYTLPSRRSITDEELPHMFMEICTKIQQVVEDNKTDFLPMFSFTTDLWSSCTMEPYISLTVHFVTADFQMMKYVLDTRYIPDRHTGVNISIALNELLAEWKLEEKHILAFTTDSAANMIKMAEEARLMRIPCFGHTLHNAVTKALETPFVKEVTGKLKRIVAYFHQSHQRQRLLEKELVSEKKSAVHLISSCPTRWGSTYDMYERIYKNLAEIKRVVVNDACHLVLTADEDNVVAMVVEAFEELSLMTDSLSAEKSVSVSAVLPMIKLIKDLQYKPLKHNRSRELLEMVTDYFDEK